MTIFDLFSLPNQFRLEHYRKLYTFTRMLPLITKIKEYEDVAAKKQTEDRDKTTLTDEDVMEIEELLGIRRHRKPKPEQEIQKEIESELEEKSNKKPIES